MKMTRKFSGVKSVLIGVCAYAACTFVLMILETMLIYNGKTEETSMLMFSCAIHIVSTAISCIVGKRLSGERKSVAAVYIGAGDMLLALVLKLLFSSTALSTILVRLLMIAIGTAIGCINFSRRGMKRKFKTRKIGIR